MKLAANTCQSGSTGCDWRCRRNSQRGVPPLFAASLNRLHAALADLVPVALPTPIAAVPKPKMWIVSCLHGNLHRDMNEAAESCTLVQGAQWCGSPPIEVAQEPHHGGHDQHAHNGSIEGDRDCQADPD